MSNYPSKIDTDETLPSVFDNVSDVSGEAINALKDAILHMEKTLGLDPQGAASDLVSRLNASLNADGTIRASALASAGLVTLPITNAQISSSAGIKESKLDLDIPTQTLSNQISSNDIDIANLNRAVTDLTARYLRHINGTGDRHLADQITATTIDGYGTGVGNDVKSALNYLYGQMLAHRLGQTPNEHFATGIRYVPRTVPAGETSVITANNVQDALTSVETAFIEDRRKHNDEAHSDGVSNDGYVIYSGQAAVNDASLKLTRYQPPASRDVVKVGLCNATTIKSKGFSPTSISSTAHSIVVTTRVSGSLRSLTISNIHLLQYPPGNSRITLNGIVDYLNGQFALSGNHFPITAFASEDGEIVLQHNIAANGCTIKIGSPISNSAVDALGFTDILGIEIGRVDNYSFQVNGSRFTELKTIAAGTASHLAPNTTDVNLGVDISGSGLNILASSLIHIYDHEVPSANGTYQIQSIASSTIARLTETLSNGSFKFIIYNDTFSTIQFSGTQKVCLDFYIASDRNFSLVNRADINYQSVSGLSIVEFSESFPIIGSSALSISVSGSSIKSMRMEYPTSIFGQTIEFPAGFIGYKKLYAPNNNDFVTIFVNASSVSTGVILISASHASDRSDDKLFLGSSHLDATGQGTIEIPLNKRPIGLVGKTSISDIFIADVLGSDIANLNSNGVIRGLSVSSSTATTVKVQGGLAYIFGRPVSKNAQTIDVQITGAGKLNLTLSNQGIFEIFEDGIYSIADLVASTDKIILAQLTVSGSAILSVADARFFINNIQSKLPLTVDDRELGYGVFRTLSAATSYASSNVFTSGSEIRVVSSITIPDALLVDDSTHIICFGDFSIDGSLTIDDNSKLEVYGSFLSSSAVNVTNGSQLILHGTGIFEDTVLLDNDSSLVLGQSSTFSGQINIGLASSISGGLNSVAIFDGNNTGMLLSDGYSSVIGIDLRMTNSPDGQHPIIQISDLANYFKIEDCEFSQTGTVSAANWANIGSDNARAGIYKTTSGNIYHGSISNCKFQNLFNGIYLTKANYIDLNSCLFSNVVYGVACTSSSDVSVYNCMFEKFKDYAINFSSCQRGQVEGCIGTDEFDNSTPPTVIMIDSVGAIITSNIIHDIVCYNAFEVSSYVTLSENVILDTSCNGYALFANSGTSGIIFTNNNLSNLKGRLASVDKIICTNNTATIIDTVGGNVGVFSAAGTVCGNRFDFSKTSPNQTEILFASGLVANNNIRCGQVFATIAADTIIDGNSISLEYGPVQVTGSASHVFKLTGNKIIGSGNFIPLTIADAANPNTSSKIISDNYIEANSNLISVKLGSVSVNSTGQWTFSNNFVKNGTQSGLDVYCDNISVVGNVFSGSSTYDIFVETIATNVYVSDNHLSSGTIGTASNPANVFIGRNKNFTEKMSFSPMGGMTNGSAGWSISGSQLVSPGPGGELYVPFVLPVGVQIIGVNILCTASVANSINIALYTRNASGSIGSPLGSALTAAGHGTAFLNLVPSTSTYVANNQEYFLKITSATAGDSVDQCVVSVKY